MGPDNRPLDLEWIEDFLALAESGHFSRAAEVRLVAQPAFSRHIRSLEEWVGVDLVDRGAHPVELTEAGPPLPSARSRRPGEPRGSAHQGTARARRCRREPAIRGHARAVDHVLPALAWRAGDAIASGPDPDARRPRARLRRSDDQRRVQFVLCYGHADVPNRLDEGGYPVIALGRRRRSCPSRRPTPIERPLHEIGRREPLPVLDYSDASGLGRILRSRQGDIFADAARGRPRQAVSIVFTAHNAFLLKTMALAGRGVAWLPASLVAEELAQGALLCAGDERWRIAVDVRLYRQTAQMAPTAEELWRVVGGGERW